MRFAHIEVTYFEPYEAPSLGDWTICRQDAVFFDGAADCVVDNCWFDAVGGNAVFVSNYGNVIRIANNVITNVGESGVCLVGKSHLRTDRTTTCLYCGMLHHWGYDEPSADIPAHYVIHNNRIHDIGVFRKQTAGVFLSLASHNTIQS